MVKWWFQCMCEDGSGGVIMMGSVVVAFMILVEWKLMKKN
jgi:hypothetical protein